MLKVILIDDESVNQKLLKVIIDWNNLGYEVSGVAFDGLEGLNLYNSVRPDVIIVDIKMPIMNGLEFIQNIRRVDTDVKIIILSAYDEFEYAQKAIPYGISAYLLKPLDENTLVNVLEDVKKAISEEMEDVNRIHRLSEEMDIVALELDFRKFMDALENGIRGEYISILLEKFNRLDKFRNYYFILIRFEDAALELVGDNKRSKIVEELKADININLCGRVFTTDKNISEFVLVVLYDSLDEAQKKLKPMVDYFNSKIPIDNVKQGKNYDVGLSSLFLSAKSLKQAHDQANLASKLAFYPDLTRVNTYEQLDEYSLLSDNYLISAEPVIKEYIHMAGTSEINQYINNSFEYFFRTKVLPVSVIDFCNKFLLMIRREVSKFYSTLDEETYQFLDASKLKNISRFDKLKNNMLKIIENFDGRLLLYKERSRNAALVAKAQTCINTNFRNTDFSTQMVADYLGLSKNYFSKIFKEVTGTAFWDYISRKRIEFAQELLKTSSKTNYEISHLVGYESEYHFSRKFKELIGVNPNQFRKR